MNVFNLIDDDGTSLGYCKSKLTSIQIQKIQNITHEIYSNTSSWIGTEILERLIKNGSIDIFEDDFDDIELVKKYNKNIFKNSKVILMKSYQLSNKKKFVKVKGYRIKSPFKDKSFKWIKAKAIEVEF